MKSQRGFTLIEVLVALVIVALGMSALLETLGSAADTATWLRDKTFAQWICFNQLATLRLVGSVPSPGTTDGELDYANRHWRWRQIVTPADDSGLFPGIERVEVKAEPADTSAVDESGWVATITGAIGDAVAPQQTDAVYLGPSLPGSQSSAPTSSAPTSSGPTLSSAPSSFFSSPTTPTTPTTTPQTQGGSL